MKTATRPRSARRNTVKIPSQRTAPQAIARAAYDERWALLPLVVGALALRLYGIFHGRSYHPDERHTVEVALGLRWGDLNPHSFAYGSVPYYCFFFLRQLLRPFLTIGYDEGFLLGRAASAIVGSLGVAATYFLARALDLRRELAFLAAAFLAVAFFPIQNCHFFTVDIWLTTASTFALLAILRLEESGDRRSAWLAGGAVGIAIAVKISALSLLLPLVLALVSRHARERDWRAREFAWPLLAVLVAFALSEPYAFLDAGRWFADLHEQMEMASGRAIRPFTLQYEHTLVWWYPLEQLIFFGLGWPLALTLVGGTLYAIGAQVRRFRPREAIVLGWTVAFFLVIGMEHTKFPRYLLPIYPILALFGAAALGDWEQALRRAWPKQLPTVWIFAPRACALAAGLAFTLGHLAIYRLPHTWLTASHWMRHEFKPGTTVVGEAWDDTLPTGIEPSHFLSTGVLPVYEPETEARLSQMLAMLERTELMPLPTARVYGSILQAPERYPQTARYYRLLFAGRLGFERIHTFKLKPQLGPWEWNDELADESFSVYTNPKVVIFRNRDHLAAPELRRRITGQDDDGGISRTQMMTVQDED